MLWSILIASHSSRTSQLERLAGLLAPQLTDDVEVVVLWNRGQKKLGEYRQMLTEAAKGDYVSNVDDDDRVPDYFVADVLAALGDDYVGFKVSLTDVSGAIGSEGAVYIADHSIQYTRWSQRGTYFYRHVSHLNPIRRTLALKGVWEGNEAEDHRWADSVYPHVKTERYIDKVMYHYDFDHRKSLRGDKPDTTPYIRPVLPDGFRYHPASEE